MTTRPGIAVLCSRKQRRRQYDGRWRRAGEFVAVLAGITMLVAACGGGNGSGSGNGSGGAAQNNPAKFAECMRGHGVSSFPDPDSDGQFSLQITKGGDLDPNSSSFKSALQTCHKYDAGFHNGGNGGSGSNNNALKFAKCMRSHGVKDFPDPRAGGGLVMGGNVQSDPHFNSAMQTCRPLLSGGGS